MSTYNIPAPAGANQSFAKHELLPPGTYDLEVVYASDVDGDGVPLTTKSGDPRIKLKVMADNEQSFYHFLYLTPKAFPMVWEFLAACGVTPEEDGEFVLDPVKLEGKRFRALVYEENGWNRLRKPMPVPSSEQSTPDPEGEVVSGSDGNAIPEDGKGNVMEVEEDDVPF